MDYHLTDADRTWVEETFEKLRNKLGAECSRLENIIPYIPKDGHYHDLDTSEGIYWWTNGFWPGMLWQMYHATGDELYRQRAEDVEKRFDEALEGYEGLHHDVGFMWLHTATANYRLTKNKDSRRRALHAANLLAGRYNPAGKFIRAWNDDRTGWIIIDTMMNLPLLYWASKETGDPRFSYIAQAHADTAMNIIVRPDGSCNHIAVLSPETGECLETPGGQGFASGSSWSRGQSWAVYGFALSFYHTGEQKYLDTAKKVAHYVIANLARHDWLPLVDFRAPPVPAAYDSTAAMISACGLLEIASLVGEYEKPLYVNAALKLLRASEKAFADWDAGRDGIIGKGTAAYNSGPDDTEVPIIYGDYFFTEAVLRLLGKDFLIW
ncbi:MAG: glycoside hydrolase family 88 protein [Treponema sp.]|jgi:unsaturated chondroitin disaccharide hydrolase|nr:glycoside hydrolase family 88 protein [Treponema sp.]